MESANMSNEEWRSMDVLGFSNYMGSKSGKIFNITNSNILKGTVKKDHVSYGVKNDKGVATTIRSNTIIYKLFTDYLINMKKIAHSYIWIPLELPKLMIPGLEKYKICEEGESPIY